MVEAGDPSVVRAHPSTGVTRRVYLGVVMASGAVVVCASALQVLSRPPGVMFAVLAALTVLSGAATVRMPGFPVSFSLSDTFTIVGALLFGPAAGALLVALDGLVISWRLTASNRTLTRVLFNVMSPALAMWIAAHLFFVIINRGALAAPPAPTLGVVGPLAVFAATYFILNTGLIAGAIAIGRPVSLSRVWRQHFLPLGLTHFGGTAIAGLLLLVIGAGLADLRTLTIVLPLVAVLLFGVLTGAAWLRGRSAQFAELRSYAAALRSTTDAVLLTNPDGRVTFMNPAAERLTGWSAAQARARHVNDIFRIEGPPPSRQNRSRADGGEEPGATREYVLVRLDGSTCPIEQTNAQIRDEDDTVTGVIYTFRDISERKAVDAELRALLLRQQEARAAADAANLSKDEFLATVSHELRTPTTAIIGWTELLLGGRLDDERRHKALAALERSARAQAAVVNDLLDTSLIVRGTLRLDVRRTNLVKVLGEAAETVEPSAQLKGIALRLNVAPDVSTIDGDPDRLRQVFWNLLSNAVKFTPEGGLIEVSALRETDLIRVDVDDSGCGIDPAFVPFVFDRFRQANGSSSRPYRGLGLGLAIVRELVELHGGTIEATSAGQGRGSRFTVRLPAGVRRRESDVAVPACETGPGVIGTGGGRTASRAAATASISGTRTAGADLE
jgi:PAS domain S-box-containing protein